MRLQNKILIILSTVWLIFLCASFVGARHFLMKSFYNLEENHIEENISRVNFALSQLQGLLSTFTLDWGHWNDAYDYVNGDNPAFVANNVETLALNNYHVGLLMYFNKKGELLVGLAIDGKSKQIMPYPKGLEKYIYPRSPLEVHSDPLKVTSGLVLMPYGIMLVAAVGTSSNDSSKPINGTLITGRFFSKEVVHQLAEITNIKLSLIYLDTVKKSKKLGNIFDKLITSSNNYYISLSNDRNAEAYILLHDIFNQPIGIIQLTLDRDIMKTGSTAIKYYLWLFLFTGVVLSLILLYLIHILVLKRLAYLNSRIQHISKKGDYTQRVKLLENDEITWLADQFNELMRNIESSDNILRVRIKN
jgi:sensor domain CHASE-containing protein